MTETVREDARGERQIRLAAIKFVDSVEGVRDDPSAGVEEWIASKSRLLSFAKGYGTALAAVTLTFLLTTLCLVMLVVRAVSGGDWLLWLLLVISGLVVMAKLSPAANARIRSNQRWTEVEMRLYVSAELERRRRLPPPVDEAAPASTRPWAPAGKPPGAHEYGVSHEGAEQLCAAWMRYLGESSAAVTQFTGDGGIDIASRHYVAQVKNYIKTVPIAAIRELHGVAADDGRKSLFFTSGTYPSSAIDFANRVGMSLFTYDAVAGRLYPTNQTARSLMENGLPPAATP